MEFYSSLHQLHSHIFHVFFKWWFLDNLGLYLLLVHLFRTKCNLHKNKLTFQMERHQSQEDHRQRTGFYDVGAVHVVVILLWVVWRNDITWRASEIPPTSYMEEKGILRTFVLRQQLFISEESLNFPKASRARVPSLWDLLPNDLRWSWCNKNRNKVHNKFNVL